MADAIISYRCACLVEEVTLTVPARLESADVVAWLDEVVRPAITADHRRRSPGCRTATSEYVKIHMDPETQRIGDPTVRQ